MLDKAVESGAPAGDGPGVVVVHSLYRVTSAPPVYWLPVTESFIEALILAVVSALVGVVVLWSRPRLRARFGGAPARVEPVLSDVLAVAPPIPKRETPVKVAASVGVGRAAAR